MRGPESLSCWIPAEELARRKWAKLKPSDDQCLAVRGLSSDQISAVALIVQKRHHTHTAENLSLLDQISKSGAAV